MVSAPSFKSKYSKQEEEQSQKVNISGGYWFIWGCHGLSSGLFPQSLPGRSYLCSCSTTATSLSTWYCALEFDEECHENSYNKCLSKAYLIIYVFDFCLDRVSVSRKKMETYFDVLTYCATRGGRWWNRRGWTHGTLTAAPRPPRLLVMM